MNYKKEFKKEEKEFKKFVKDMYENGMPEIGFNDDKIGLKVVKFS